VIAGGVTVEVGASDEGFADELGAELEGLEEAGAEEAGAEPQGLDEAGEEAEPELDALAMVDDTGAVDFSVTVDLASEEAGEELALPPLPEHLPPEERVTSTQSFWSLTGVV
jgi:hypothetical protein